ncbi:MAG: EamA family transporter RarD, partial [Woeseia sp.]
LAPMPQKQATPVGEAPENRGRNGIIAALCAYLMWGFLPIYFKAVQQVAALEILSHRVLWAIPFGAMIIALRRQWPEVRRALTHRRTLGLLTLAAIFIAINWLVFVWAVQQSQIFQASLGYYINPLIYVVIGVLFLGETLRRLQVAAVLLAVAGVAVLTFSGGEFPLISLALAVSFTTYGVIRKQTVVGGMPGLFIETIILMPLALGYIAWATEVQTASFAAVSRELDGLLILAGPVTVLPLLCFALAARRLTLSTLGFMQFITPTMQFVTGLLYGEQLTVAHAICFSCIWIAVALFSWDAWKRSRMPVTPSGP